MYIGWDWATETHDVTVMDNTGARVDRWEFAHTEEGIARMLAKLAESGSPADLPVAIETTRGLIVDRLLQAGHPVVPVHQNAFHAMRPRWGASKAKTDAGDSLKFADYLRTDGHFLPRLKPTERATMEIQALTRQRADHLAARIAAVNQLAAGRLEAWCKRHGYSGKRLGSLLIERLRSAPQPASRLSESVIEQLVRVQVQLVKSIRATIRTLDAAITDAVSSHPYPPLLATMPRIGTISLGQIIGEIGPILERSRTSEQFIAETGVVPVTRASGKSRVVTFRHATNRRARLAIVA